LGGIAGDREGCAVGGVDVEGVERPGRFDAAEQRGAVGVEGDRETSERNGKTAAEGFDVGFLAGPAAEEGGFALGFGIGEERIRFAGRKEAARDGFEFELGADAFDIDSYFGA
jgi:hypothetical protein